MSATTANNLQQELAQLAEAVRARAAELLSSGEVSLVIGHERPWIGSEAIPAFVKTPERAAELVVGPQCATVLAGYLMDEAGHGTKVAVVARGCDALGVRRLIADRRVAEEDVHVIGLPCLGRIDPVKLSAAAGLESGATVDLEFGSGGLRIRRAAGEEFAGGPQLSEVLADSCLVCDVRKPEGCDELLGEDLPGLMTAATAPPVRTWEEWEAEVEELASRSPDDRYAFWAEQFTACIRCFACRNACPACSCRVCSLDSYQPKWLGHPTELPEQFMFHFIRATDVAGRCVACGECARVCPANLPLMYLNLKLMHDIRSLFGVDRPHVPQEIEPLGKFESDDPEEFM